MKLTKSLAVCSVVLFSCASDSEMATEPQFTTNERSDFVNSTRTCATGTDSLKRYATKCDAAMGGVTVPTFNCNNGVELAGKETNGFQKNPDRQAGTENVTLRMC